MTTSRASSRLSAARRPRPRLRPAWARGWTPGGGRGAALRGVRGSRSPSRAKRCNDPGSFCGRSAMDEDLVGAGLQVVAGPAGAPGARTDGGALGEPVIGDDVCRGDETVAGHGRISDARTRHRGVDSNRVQHCGVPAVALDELFAESANLEVADSTGPHREVDAGLG